MNHPLNDAKLRERWNAIVEPASGYNQEAFRRFDERHGHRAVLNCAVPLARAKSLTDFAMPPTWDLDRCIQAGVGFGGPQGRMPPGLENWRYEPKIRPVPQLPHLKSLPLEHAKLESSPWFQSPSQALGLARRDFFDAVQARGPGQHRLCGLIADEFPLIAQPEDVEQLATVRSKRCFVMAATQSLIALDERLGSRRRQAVLLNFNSLVFMRTRELDVGDLATASLGERRPPKKAGSRKTSHVLLFFSNGWICPPGALGRLQPHQAFAVLADGTRTHTPVWFVPWFDEAARSTPPSPSAHYASEHVERLMTESRYHAVQSVDLVVAAARLDEHRRESALRQATDFFRSKACRIPLGLESLPACWLAGLPGILCGLRQPHWTHVPFMISRLGCEEGVLIIHFAQEEPPEENGLTPWDEIRVAVNARLYPNRWRRLKRRHRMLLWFARPDLRPLLGGGSMTVD